MSLLFIYALLFVFTSSTRTCKAFVCGRPKIPPHIDTIFKISGGTVAVPFSWPWQVSMLVLGSPTKICDGTLIDCNWVISAAQCYSNQPIAAILSFGKFQLSKAEPGSVYIDIEDVNSSVIIYPDFDPNTMFNDIALIKLPEKVLFTDHIIPVCLPRHDTEVNQIGKQFIVTGWGKINESTYITDKLHQVTIPIQPAHQRSGCKSYHHFKDERQLCAGGVGHPKKGACRGDTGGPLVRKKKKINRWFQYGITSRAWRPCANNINGVAVLTILASSLTTTHAVKCGRPKIPPHVDTVFKISGGKVVVPYSWPWQVNILVLGSPSTSCGGTMIDHNWVLSAAHCFGNTPVVLVLTFGVFDITKEEPGSVARAITNISSSVIIHPDYDPDTVLNDIALIRLPEEVPCTNHISPVCLPRRDSRVNKIGKMFITTGWGKTNETTQSSNELRQVTVPIQPFEQLPGCKPYDHTDKDRQLCAGGVDHPNKGICKGDSGGPLVCKQKKRNRWFQYGITSRGGHPCGSITMGKADVFTRVAHHCNWIEGTIGRPICLPKNQTNKIP